MERGSSRKKPTERGPTSQFLLGDSVVFLTFGSLNGGISYVCIYIYVDNIDFISSLLPLLLTVVCLNIFGFLIHALK